MLEEIWNWLLKPENQKTVTFFGGGLVVVVGALWTLYTHFSKKPEAPKIESDPEIPARLERKFRFYNVPLLPLNYQPRPDDLGPLMEEVLGPPGQAVGIIGAARNVGLHGMGGIGKSVLAAALAHDDEVRGAFPDGVFWLSFGRQASATAKQAELLWALGQPAPALDDWHEGRAQLRVLIDDRACLVILDDIWKEAHAEAFTQLGPKCRLLVTTRILSVLEKIGATERRLNVLKPEKALELLADYAGLRVADLPSEAGDVAKECGYLPLALAAVGNLIRAGRYTWQGAMDRLRAADLERLHARLPDYDHPGVLAALEISVEDLPDDAKGAFLDCAVFPEDVDIPEAALKTLWSGRFANPEDAADAAHLLVERSLTSRNEAREYRLHDLYHEYVRAMAEDPAAPHRRLIDAYKARCPDGWATGPDDGYFFQHLPRHLDQAGEGEALRALLLDYDWIAANLKAADDEGLRWVQQASRGAKTPWLRPVTASLTPPGGPLLRILQGHLSGVTAVAALDGERAISASYDHTIRLWDLESGEVIATFHGEGPMLSVCAAGDDTFVAGSANGAVHILKLVE